MYPTALGGSAYSPDTGGVARGKGAGGHVLPIRLYFMFEQIVFI